MMSLKDNLIRRVAQRARWKEFLERTEGETSVRWLRKVAGDLFDLIGEGAEAQVYGISPDTVLKVSRFEKNMRNEWEAFTASKFRDVTPEAFDHDPNWHWITVERVKSFGKKGWLKLANHFPSLLDEVGISRFPREFDLLPLWIARGEKPDWFDNLDKDERDWFLQITSLHQSLGIDPADIRPRNLGLDGKGRVVLFDIYSFVQF